MESDNRLTPKPPGTTKKGWNACPNCHKRLVFMRQKYCDYCGQAVEWPEKKKAAEAANK